MSTRWFNWLFLAAGLLGPAATPSLAQGTIGTTVLPNPMVIQSDMLNAFLYPIDLNGDGVEDFTFGADVGFVGLRTERANRVIYRPDPPPNLGGLVARLEDGFQIGSSLEPSLGWRSSDLLGGYVSPGEWAFAAIAIHLSTGSSSEWPGSPGARGFIGIGFELEDGWHYGYFDVIMAAEAGGMLLGWAYNSIPNAPLFASPVPEPSTWALLIGGGVLMVWFKGKRNERRGQPDHWSQQPPCLSARCWAAVRMPLVRSTVPVGGCRSVLSLDLPAGRTAARSWGKCPDARC